MQQPGFRAPLPGTREFAARAVHEVVPVVPSAARHALVWGGTEVRLADGLNLIGREPPAGVTSPASLPGRRLRPG